MKQATQITKQTDAIQTFAMFDQDHRVSWKVAGAGTASLEVQACSLPSRKWVSLVCTETPETFRGEKKTYISLDTKAALALRDFLNQAL